MIRKLAWLSILCIASLPVLAADVGGVAFWAHVAGFVAGLGLVFVFRQPERQKVEWWDGVR